MLVWIILKGRLLTNVECGRRHLTNDTACPICLEEEETIKHLLWDCGVASDVWRFTSCPDDFSFRQSDTMESWIKRNATSKVWTVDHMAWDSRFVFVLLGLWISRNKMVFNSIWPNGRHTTQLARKSSMKIVSLLSHRMNNMDATAT